MTIGIFDSGLGGELVAQRLKNYFPDAKFTVTNDRTHLPYGDRPPDEIYTLTKLAIQPLIGKVDVVVIACNTATAAAIDQLRADFPDQKFVGYEPMVKPAASQTRSGKIVILATPATLASTRFKKLVTEYGENVQVFTPDCSSWAKDIETNEVDEINLDEVAQAVADGADVIALACTHYLALESRLRQQFPDTQVIEPTPAVAGRITVTSQLPQ
jgi:glutamate racemase